MYTIKDSPNILEVNTENLQVASVNLCSVLLRSLGRAEISSRLLSMYDSKSLTQKKE